MIELKKIDAQLKERLEGFLLMQLEVWFMLRDKVLEAQQKEVEIDKVKNKIVKMYRYLKEFYWWPNIKREIVKCLDKSDVCQ
jgi:hypothetical protein